MNGREEWRPAPSYPGYEASSRGRVREVGGDPIRQFALNGYLIVHVTIGAGTATRGAHQIVCDAFHGPAPAGHEVDHGNSRRGDNRPSNLEWVTRSENMLRACSRPADRAASLANGMRMHMAAKRRRLARAAAAAAAAATAVSQ